MYQNYFKRLIDIIVSIILIIILMPLMIIIFILVWIFIGFPIFTQLRPGLYNKLFTIYKFRTLYDEPIDELKRQSKFGNFLRRTGLDELPQLFNILFNDMSFVGPRPLLVKYLKFKNFQKHERSKCKPGIAGLAQIQSFENSNCKRRKSKWQIQFTMDREYYRNMSFKLDIIIICKTFLKFLKFNKIDYLNETRLLKKHIK